MDSHGQHPDATRRHWLKRRILWLAVALLGLVAVWFSWRLYFSYSAGRELGAYLVKLDATDPGWRLEEIEAYLETIPDNRNAALVVVACRKLLPEKWPAEKLNSFGMAEPTLDKRIRDLSPVVPLDESLLQELRQELTPLGSALAQARRLVDLPQGHHTITWSPDFLSTQFKGFDACRDVSVLLRLDAVRWAHEEKLNESLDACRSAVNAGRSLGDDPLVLLSYFMRLSCVRLTLLSVERALAQGQSGADNLKSLQHLLEDEERQPLFLKAVRGERAGVSPPNAAYGIARSKLAPARKKRGRPLEYHCLSQGAGVSQG